MEEWETHVLCFFLSRFPSHKVGGQIGAGFAQCLLTLSIKMHLILTRIWRIPGQKKRLCTATFADEDEDEVRMRKRQVS